MQNFAIALRSMHSVIFVWFEDMTDLEEWKDTIKQFIPEEGMKIVDRLGYHDLSDNLMGKLKILTYDRETRKYYERIV